MGSIPSPPRAPHAANEADAIRPFRVRMPDLEVPEAELDALPQFVTRIDGLDIHFVHVRSGHPDALPLMMTHERRGSVFALEKMIAPLTDPTAHGSHDADAFDVVMPSLPGFGFSGVPGAAVWSPERVARAWHALMKRLGYTRYVAQGSGWGAAVSRAMADDASSGLLGIHLAVVGRTAAAARVMGDDDAVIVDAIAAPLPVAVTVFAGGADGWSRALAERAFGNLAYFHCVGRAGRFPAWEQPALLTRELRAAFRPLRQAHPLGPKRSVRMRNGS